MIGRSGYRTALSFVNEQKDVDMVGHNYIFVNVYASNFVSRKNPLLHNPSKFCQLALRGVEGAAPYNAGQDVFRSWVHIVRKYAPGQL